MKRATALFLLLAWPASAGGPRPAFYYWKTRWSPLPELLRALSDAGAGRLYLRFFDVKAGVGGPHPVAPLAMDGPLPEAVDVVPVVFFSNAVFERSNDMGALAEKVWMKVERMSERQGIRFRQLQVDCDWTDGTRVRFFAFVAALRKLSSRRGVALSATIRLHQIKYRRRTGVPPVDRGMLMFYNVGRIEAAGPRNSIYNDADAAKYASSIADYPLPLDVALPVFSWAVHSRGGRVVGLLAGVDAADFASSGGVASLGGATYRAAKSFFFRGRYLKEGDSLRFETMDPVGTRAAAAQVVAGAGKGKAFGTVAFFDLDVGRLKRYVPSDFQAILRVFR